MGSEKRVIQIYGGDYVQGIEMNMFRNYKIVSDYAGSVNRVSGVSPFCLVGDSNLDFQKFLSSNRKNSAVKVDIEKCFDSICKRCFADYFICDNFEALSDLVQIGGEYYTLRNRDSTDFMDYLLLTVKENPSLRVSPIASGITAALINKYDKYIDAILSNYQPDKVILVRSHVSPIVFYHGELVISERQHTSAIKEILDFLDNYFIKKVNCLTLETALRYFQENPKVNRFYLNAEFSRTLVKDIIDTINIKKADFSIQFTNFSEKVINRESFDIKENYKKMIKYIDKNSYSYEDVLYFAYLFSEDDVLSRDLARHLVNNSSGHPNIDTIERVSSNIELLRNYKYNYISLARFTKLDSFYIMLSELAVMCVDAVNGISISNKLSGNYSQETYISNAYNGNLAETIYAIADVDLYILRGRQRITTPFVLRFNTSEEFYQALYYFDFSILLNNENVCIILDGESLPECSTYFPKTDLSFIFNENVCIKIINNGLAGQIQHFVHTQSIADTYDLDIYYDDLAVDSNFLTNGLEVEWIASTPIESKLISNKLSEILRQTIKSAKKKVYPLTSSAVFWGEHIEDALFIMFDSLNHFNRIDISSLGVFSFVSTSDASRIESLVSTKFTGVKIVSSFATAGLAGIASYKKYIKFPEFAQFEIKNIEVASKIMSTDAVALHLRYGDYAISHKISDEHIYATIEDVIKNTRFSHLSKKFLFVFSDDMFYVREHLDSLGINLFGDNVVLVDWNHHFSSYRDMHLISLCKIIVRTIGSFSKCAAYISSSVEHFLTVKN
jgi:hypothetical protein